MNVISSQASTNVVNVTATKLTTGSAIMASYTSGSTATRSLINFTNTQFNSKTISKDQKHLSLEIELLSD